MVFANIGTVRMFLGFLNLYVSLTRLKDSWRAGSIDVHVRIFPEKIVMLVVNK